MGEIGVEYCEIGFILNENYSEPNCGIWRNLNKDFSIISKLKSETNTKTKIVVMFDIGDYDKYNYDYTLIPEQKETQIDLIRVCCFYKILDRTKDVIMNLHSKGYNLTLNIMYASHLTSNDIINSKNFVKNLPIEYLYFADSIGGLTGNDTANFFINLKDIHPIKNGFHNHDNNGTVFNNIDNILKSNIDIIDTTIHGFGKNGGNCPFELIILYLIIKENYSYNIDKVLEFLHKIQSVIFYEEKNININMIKEMLQQFLNIHPSHVKQYNNLNLLEYYNSIKLLKGKSKW
jgi:4-hydroxy 2-oxovalerate aldolase